LESTAIDLRNNNAFELIEIDITNQSRVSLISTNKQYIVENSSHAVWQTKNIRLMKKKKAQSKERTLLPDEPAMEDWK
jgi:hypothetical protein